jgi:uncharacterized protein (DUF2147 family)
MRTADRALSRLDRRRDSIRSRARHRLGRAALLLATLASLALPRTVAGAAIPPGVWLMDGEVAVQIFDCAGLLCGRILWLLRPRDPEGELNKDRKNPDPALRQRPLCGLTILWGLHQTAPDRWSGGGFYNPDDGETYNVSAQLKSPDVIVARIYSGFPLFGRTKTLSRVSHGTSDGWC